MTTRVAVRASHDLIRERTPFTTHGSMSGKTHRFIGWGSRLPEAWKAVYRHECPTYTVYSYATAIAWWSPEFGWTIPAVSYSVTTSKHQANARLAAKTYREDL